MGEGGSELGKEGISLKNLVRSGEWERGGICYILKKTVLQGEGEKGLMMVLFNEQGW